MSQVNTNAIYDASGGSAAVLYGVASPPNSMGFRNRIINGDMRIDRRNAGASVAPDASGIYTVDRWKAWEDSDGAATVQQVTEAPSGFVNSLKWTTTTADGSLSAAQYCAVGQLIEGFNTADLAWGTSSASSVTLSFWVRSSLTGTFGGTLTNGASTFRAYPFTYTISSANTWEQKSITIAGDTSGTWATNNSAGIRLYFGLGVGSTYSGTAGSWVNGALLFSATGAVSVIGTLNATWQITGVQLEAGSVATPFERRDYGRELMMCQRYLPAWSGSGPISSGWCAGSTTAFAEIALPVAPRVAPTGITVSSASHFSVYNSGAGAVTCTALAFNQGSLSSLRVNITVASGLVAGNGTGFTAGSASAQLLATGCEL